MAIDYDARIWAPLESTDMETTVIGEPIGAQLPGYGSELVSMIH
jgi:hypothetical protein